MKNIVIVDIDGTMSKVGDRLKYLQQSPKDWDAFYEACDQDEPNIDICRLVDTLDSYPYELYFCTGRRESTRTKTIDWIRKNVFVVNVAECWLSDHLLMRNDGDYRHDTIVKPELLEAHGISVDSVAFILEDRSSMVKKWRKLGFTCLQVAEGDF